MSSVIILFTKIYITNKIDPNITSIPKPIPITVGQFVPDCGRDALVGADVLEPVAVGVAVPQLQSVLVGQDGFLQKPL